MCVCVCVRACVCVHACVRACVCCVCVCVFMYVHMGVHCMYGPYSTPHSQFLTAAKCSLTMGPVCMHTHTSIQVHNNPCTSTH